MVHVRLYVHEENKKPKSSFFIDWEEDEEARLWGFETWKLWGVVDGSMVNEYPPQLKCQGHIIDPIRVCFSISASPFQKLHMNTFISMVYMKAHPHPHPHPHGSLIASTATNHIILNTIEVGSMWFTSSLICIDWSKYFTATLFSAYQTSMYSKYHFPWPWNFSLDFDKWWWYHSEVQKLHCSTWIIDLDQINATRIEWNQ